MTIGKPHPLSLAKYEIQSDLLYELLTYSDGLPTRLGFSNWNVDHSDARPMMTLIAMRAFDLYRLPWHHDRCFSIPAPDPARLRALACVTDAMLVEAVLDTRRLYEHTQTALGKTGHSHIALNRSLYSEGLGRWGNPVQTGYASFVSQHRRCRYPLGSPIVRNQYGHPELVERRTLRSTRSGARTGRTDRRHRIL